MADVKCRAKNPETCWKHGSQTPGSHAYAVIRQAIQLQPETVRATTTPTTTPLKQLSSGSLATEIYSYAIRTEGVNVEKVRKAILLAADLHQPDSRSNRGDLPRTPYIEHPLRNALRSIRYGGGSTTLIIGNLLHDTVEDHPLEFANRYGKHNFVAGEEDKAREACFVYIKKTFGTEAMEMVRGMSNPIELDKEHKFSPASHRNQIYADHVEEAIQNPNVLVGKVCDFTDNAVGLYHNAKGQAMDTKGIMKRAKKYLPVCDILEKRLLKAKLEKNFPVPIAGIDAMLQQIRTGRTRLQTLITVFEE